MKCLASLLVVFLSVVVINGYPQRVTLVGIPRSDFFASPFEQDRRNREIEDGTTTTSDSEETDLDGRGPPSIFEVSDNPYYYSPSVAEMMANMQAMIARLKLEMSEVLKRIPDTSDEKGVASGSDYPNIFSIGSGLDLSNAQNKSTSKTQVIDGQTYVVNETVVRSGDDDHGSVFRIKTIQLKPAHTTTGTETELEVTDSTQSGGVDEPQTSTKVNPSKNEDNNEIPNEGKVRFTEWESSENIENIPSDHLNEVETSNEVELLEPTDSFKPVQYDLSHDTLVNDYVSDQHVAQGLVLIDPDAEFIDIDKTKSNHNDYYRYESQPLYPSANKFEKLVQ